MKIDVLVFVHTIQVGRDLDVAFEKDILTRKCRSQKTIEDLFFGKIRNELAMRYRIEF